MRASVTFEYPVTYVPVGARSPRTQNFRDTINVDIPEIASFETTDAVHVTFSPGPDHKREVDRMRQAGLAAYLLVRSEELRLNGHDGRLWRDCWAFSRQRFHEIHSDALRQHMTPEYNGADNEFEVLREQWASPDGQSEPPNGFLHWLDRRADGCYIRSIRGKFPDRQDPCIIRLGAHNVDRSFPENAKEIIANGRSDKAALVASQVEGKFAFAGGKLFEAVLPPTLRAQRSVVLSTSKIDREEPPVSPNIFGCAWFRFDEADEWRAFLEKINISHAPIDHGVYENWNIVSLDPRYLTIDKTDLAIRSLEQSFHNMASFQFAELPDVAIYSWMTLRDAFDEWDPKNGDPSRVYDAYDAFCASVPASFTLVRGVLRKAAFASNAQRPDIDLSPRYALGSPVQALRV